MVTIHRGHTFGSTDVILPADLHGLIDDAIISAVSTTELATGLSLFKLSQAGTTDDTNGLSSDGYVEFYYGSAWNRPGIQVFTNNSGYDIDATEVVVLDPTGDMAIKKSEAEGGVGDVTVVGVTLEDIADGASGRVGMKGVFDVFIARDTILDFVPGDFVFAGNGDPGAGTGVKRSTLVGIGSYDHSVFATLLESVTTGLGYVTKKCLVFR